MNLGLLRAEAVHSLLSNFSRMNSLGNKEAFISLLDSHLFNLSISSSRGPKNQSASQPPLAVMGDGGW